MTSATWLVTGASGFVGAALLRLLQGTGQPLLVAGRRAPSANDAAASRWIGLDLAGPAIDLPPGIDTVLHLAGEKRAEARMDEVNHRGAARLVDAAARAGVRRFVHLSSVGVYGAPKHAGVVDERRPHLPVNAYERSKDAGERAVRERCGASAMACVVLQPSNVIGWSPQARPLLGLMRIVARGWFRYFGQTEAWVNYVGVDDVAGALIAAARADRKDATCIVNTPVPLRQMIGWIADELTVPPPRASWPYPVGAGLAAAGALGRSVLGRELPFSPERLQELTNTTRYDGSAISRALAFDYPCGIETSLRTLARNYRREGWL
jgi:nucleoside-diphosphate-sugar epimerase